ncbi:hypothetical protein [Deinococcus peraridilitoris]|uniref:Uncharacterized protein n=1 Tax=Deinococcus peraridilitoris (strain DSM 19664 / LMG 22246 / CIP 109416 / KR-200) TaxID=937777 RepID=L0A0K8_DEIPD|nr:hypothetical protein [Deinococcus peraridilitoris]AFZ67428.1 hypothetical protein Deipe_1924 [Deinococcus peraridilitoris DSM 19664]
MCSFPDGYMVMFPVGRAVELARIRRAVARSETWGDLRCVIPREEWERLSDGALDGPRFEMPEEDEVPDDEPFDRQDLATDHLWLVWPQNEMLYWVPEDIQKRYGSRMDTPDSYLLLLDAGEMTVPAMRRQGYSMYRAEYLVEFACGYLGYGPEVEAEFQRFSRLVSLCQSGYGVFEKLIPTTPQT